LAERQPRRAKASVTFRTRRPGRRMRESRQSAYENPYRPAFDLLVACGSELFLRFHKCSPLGHHRAIYERYTWRHCERNGGLASKRAIHSDSHGNRHLRRQLLGGSGLIKGRLSSTPSQIELRYGWHGTYSGVVSGNNVSLAANAHGSGALIPVSRSVHLNETLRVCVVHGRCATSVQGIDLPLQPEMDGTWRLDITLFTESPKLTGQAVVTLPTGRGFGYQVSGTQNLKTGSMIFRLKGMNDASTSFLTLDTQGFNQGTVVKLQGRLLGQKLKFP
jgi:hypothetical protein